MRKIKEGDIVQLHPTMFDNQRYGFVWKIEKVTYKYIVTPGYPSATEERQLLFYSVWVFGWGKSYDFLRDEISLCDYDA